MKTSRTFPCEVDRAFDLVLPMPLALVFRRGYGPIPPVRSTKEPAEWNEAGHQREIQLAGNGTVVETLTEVERPTQFSYQLSDAQGPIARFINSALGRWEFVPAGTGVRVTWTWVVTPQQSARFAMPAFAWLWRGYARQALDEVETHVIRP